MKLILGLAIYLSTNTIIWAVTPTLTHVTLYDGTFVDAPEIKEIVTTDNGALDSVELKSGDIFYDVEITSIGLQLGDSLIGNLPLSEVGPIWSHRGRGPRRWIWRRVVPCFYILHFIFP